MRGQVQGQPDCTPGHRSHLATPGTSQTSSHWAQSLPCHAGHQVQTAAVPGQIVLGDACLGWLQERKGQGWSPIWGLGLSWEGSSMPGRRAPACLGLMLLRVGMGPTAAPCAPSTLEPGHLTAGLR